MWLPTELLAPGRRTLQALLSSAVLMMLTGCSPEVMQALGAALADAGTTPARTSSAVAAGVPRSKLMVFGGRNHDVYLGCLNCSEYASDSVFNEYGTYGNSYNTNSILNKFGTYGSKYSSTSPCNPYTSTPPVVVDGAGNFYGYLTVNEYRAKRVTDSRLLAWLAGVCAG